MPKDSQGAARQAGARLWRPAAVLAVLTCGLLASAAAVPAAFATMLPDKGPSRGCPGDCHRSAAGQAG
jgi:hypothetical protein